MQELLLALVFNTTKQKLETTKPKQCTGNVDDEEEVAIEWIADVQLRAIEAKALKTNHSTKHAQPRMFILSFCTLVLFVI